MLTEYKKLNESFEKKLVFHLGSRSGFFSEYNCMLLCMIYCLQHEIQFQLYSRDLSISVRDGWTDFFEPFCPETTKNLHRLFNSRFPRPTPQFKLRKAMGPLVKALCGCDYLTYELWDDFRALSAQEAVAVPALDRFTIHTPPDCLVDAVSSPRSALNKKRGEDTASTTLQPCPQHPAPTNFQSQVSHFKFSSIPLRARCRELIEMTWRFQPEIEQEIRQKAAKAHLPTAYLAVHIRGGDKIKEYEGSPLTAYITKLETVSDLRDVLVMTDDYRIFEQLIANFPDWRFHTLESPVQQGYQHRKNKRKSTAEKRAGTIRFFTGIELAAAADHFVGTFSSNVGSYLGMRMDPKQCHAVDFDHWKM